MNTRKARRSHTIVYYRVVIEWGKYPCHDDIERKYVEFSYSKRKFVPIEGLEMRSDTSIQEKVEYLKEKLNKHPIKVEKVVR